MKTIMLIFKIIGLIFFFPFIPAGFSLFFTNDYINGIIVILIGFMPCFFIIRNLRKSKNTKRSATEFKKNIKICPVCGKKMTWLNTPMLAAELKTGGKPCISCLNKISKHESSFASHVGNYTIDEIKDLINNPPQANALKRVIKNDEIRATGCNITFSVSKPQVVTNTSTSLSRDFDLMQIASRTKQLLETLEIIETSPNPDTIVGRATFLKDILNEMIVFRGNKKFVTAIQKGIDSYKVMYYDKIIPQRHLVILMNPENAISLFNRCYEQCLIDGCLRYFEKQLDQIRLLKQQKSKNNRIGKLEVMLFYTLDELKRAGLDDTQNVLKDNFQSIKNEWYKVI